MISIISFIITFILVLITGVYLHPEGFEFSNFILKLEENPLILLKGLPFSTSLLFILYCHEYGHRFAAKRNGVLSTKPFFIPAPPFITLGTFGAIIKIKSPIPSRISLLEIGFAGPFFGFIATSLTAILGYYLIFLGFESPIDFGVNLRLPLGLSLFHYIFFNEWKSKTIIFENPFLASAFIGFFVQGLNLLPVGQFDGGHILYSFFKEKHNLISKSVAIIFLLLTPFGLHFLIWAILFFILGTKHPPTLNDEIQLSKREILLGIFSLFIFILSFQPLPFIFD